MSFAVTHLQARTSGFQFLLGFAPWHVVNTGWASTYINMSKFPESDPRARVGGLHSSSLSPCHSFGLVLSCCFLGLVSFALILMWTHVGEAQLPPVWREGGDKGQQPGHPSVRAEPGGEGHWRAGNRSGVPGRREAPPKTGEG